MSLWRTLRWSGGATPRTDAWGFWQAPKTLDAADPQIPNLPLESPTGGIVDADGVSTGTSTVSGVGQSIPASDGASVGVGIVTGVGQSIPASDALSAGVGIAAAAGAGILSADA